MFVYPGEKWTLSHCSNNLLEQELILLNPTDTEIDDLLCFWSWSVHRFLLYNYSKVNRKPSGIIVFVTWDNARAHPPSSSDTVGLGMGPIVYCGFPVLCFLWKSWRSSLCASCLKSLSEVVEHICCPFWKKEHCKFAFRIPHSLKPLPNKNPPYLTLHSSDILNWPIFKSRNSEELCILRSCGSGVPCSHEDGDMLW